MFAESHLSTSSCDHLGLLKVVSHARSNILHMGWKHVYHYIIITCLFYIIRLTIVPFGMLQVRLNRLQKVQQIQSKSWSTLSTLPVWKHCYVPQTVCEHGQVCLGEHKISSIRYHLTFLFPSDFLWQQSCSIWKRNHNRKLCFLTYLMEEWEQHALGQTAVYFFWCCNKSGVVEDVLPSHNFIDNRYQKNE